MEDLAASRKDVEPLVPHEHFTSLIAAAPAEPAASRPALTVSAQERLLRETEELEEKVKQEYDRLCSGRLPRALKDTPSSPPNMYDGVHADLLAMNTKSLPYAWFTDSDPCHVERRLGRLAAIYGRVVELAESGSMVDKATFRRPWDQLLDAIRVRPQDPAASFTDSLSEVTIQMCASSKARRTLNPIEDHAVDQAEGEPAPQSPPFKWPEGVTTNSALFYRTSLNNQKKVMAALGPLPSVPDENEINVLSDSKSKHKLRILLLCVESKHALLMNNIGQAIMLMTSMLHHRHALGFRDTVCFGIAANATVLRILGSVKDACGTAHVFFCESLDMTKVSHWWKCYFFLHNLEEWGRTTLEGWVAGIHGPLPLYRWRADRHRPPANVSRKRKCEEDESEEGTGPSNGGAPGDDFPPHDAEDGMRPSSRTPSRRGKQRAKRNVSGRARCGHRRSALQQALRDTCVSPKDEDTESSDTLGQSSVSENPRAITLEELLAGGFGDDDTISSSSDAGPSSFSHTEALRQDVLGWRAKITTAGSPHHEYVDASEPTIPPPR